MLIIFVGNFDVSYADCTKYYHISPNNYIVVLMIIASEQKPDLDWCAIWNIAKSILPYSLEIESKTEYVAKYAVVTERR